MKRHVIVGLDGYVNCVSETPVESDGQLSIEMNVPEDMIDRGLSAFRVAEGVCMYDEAKAEIIRIESISENERARRNGMLAKTDYLMSSDYPILDELREQWRVYRQALRDLPAQEGWPSAIVWPELPEERDIYAD